MAFTHVDKPIRLRGLEIRNRVVRTAHATNLGGGTISEDLIAYHEARAKGGVGLTIVEIMGVHPSSPGTLSMFDPELDKRYPELIARTRPHGMAMFQQLWHGGHNAIPVDGGAPWSASDIPSPAYNVVPVPMTKGMIDEIVDSYAETARRCEQWGLNGVELHGCHGYLPAQFLSPNANKRTDDYGGPFENRARFTLEVMQAIRDRVSADFVVGIRVAHDDTVGGNDSQDFLRLALMLEERGLVDFVNISMGNYNAFPKMIGGMHEPTGYELPTSTPVSRGLKTPTIVIGRFRTLEEADQVIRDGDADMVAMTRAHIADPALVAKTLAGKAEQVRPCIACNQGCVGNLLGPAGKMSCVVNPGAGFEATSGDDRLVPAETPKTVFVVGGGPAGLEAARAAALRGHRVILAEAEPALGGQLKLAARAPTRANMLDIAWWLEQEVYRLGVEVRLSTYVDVEDILAERPDSVIIATGSLPRMDGIQLSNPGEPVEGMDRANVISTHDLFAAPQRDYGKSAVVIDDVGHFEAIAAAEQLVSLGLSVTFVTRHTAFGPGVESALMTEPALQRLQRGDFGLRTRTRALSVDDQGVLVGPIYLPRTSNQVERLPADTVVFISHNRPNRDLYDALVEAGLSVSIVGDANTPRQLQLAIREGHLAGAHA